MVGLVIVAVLVAAALSPAPAQAAQPAWQPAVIATWYGKDFYGRGTACGQVYDQRIRGVAHRTLPCGTILTIRCTAGLGTPAKCHGRTVHVRVIDRGPYSGATFDLSARTAMDLCDCWSPYTMKVRWHS